MPTPKCPSIKQLEPPIRVTSTSLLVYLETSELAEYTPLRLWSLSGPSLSHFPVYEEQHLGAWRPHIPAPLVQRGLTYTSLHALSFWHCQLTKHSKRKEQQSLNSPHNKAERKNTNSMHAFLPAQVPCLIHP